MVNYEVRLQKTITLMKEENTDCLVISRPTHILYLTGISLYASDRLNVLVVRKSGELLFVLNRLSILPLDNKIETAWYGDWENGIEVLSGTIEKGASVEADYYMPYGFLKELAELRNDILVKPPTYIVERARMIKDSEEIALLKVSSQKNDIII